MAIEIRELYIRVTVNAPGAPPGGPPGAAEPGAPAAADGAGDAKDAIVAECVEQVLEILRNKTER